MDQFLYDNRLRNERVNFYCHINTSFLSPFFPWHFAFLMFAIRCQPVKER